MFTVEKLEEGLKALVPDVYKIPLDRGIAILSVRVQLEILRELKTANKKLEEIYMAIPE